MRMYRLCSLAGRRSKSASLIIISAPPRFAVCNRAARRRECSERVAKAAASLAQPLWPVGRANRRRFGSRLMSERAVLMLSLSCVASVARIVRDDGGRGNALDRRQSNAAPDPALRSWQVSVTWHRNAGRELRRRLNRRRDRGEGQEFRACPHKSDCSAIDADVRSFSKSGRRADIPDRQLCANSGRQAIPNKGIMIKPLRGLVRPAWQDRAPWRPRRSTHQHSDRRADTAPDPRTSRCTEGPDLDIRTAFALHPDKRFGFCSTPQSRRCREIRSETPRHHSGIRYRSHVTMR
jgi:hypothetical protein